jgi:transposase
MLWKPSRLTRRQMEERRLEAARLLRQGQLSQAAIARQLGVTRMSVSHWNRRLRDVGRRGLKLQKATGRPSRLTKEQCQALLKRLKRGALPAGFDTDRWTLNRIQQVIQHEFGVVYHPNYLSRALNHWGWSAQKPETRALEREQKLVTAWLKHDWSRVKKSAAATRSNRV